MARRGDRGSSGGGAGPEGDQLAPVVPLFSPGGKAVAAGFELPTFSRALLGRHREQEALARRLGSARLVTLTGPGGIGKTRLAVEVAGRAPGRALFVDLAPVRDERLVAEEVAAAFGLGELRGRDLAALLEAAPPAETLVVLDNCEHVAGACAAVARELVAGTAEVRVLATSQQPLGVAGEVEWPVGPLALPPAGADLGPEEALHSPAVALFCARAAAAKPGFVPGPAEVGAIVEICRRLEANPLAIELAAAWARALSPAEIAARLGRRFQLLRARPGATDARHQSLATALGWSWDLLTGPERALLGRLSVFAGSFGLGAVEEVCAGGEVGPDDVVELLTGVIAKSLVAADVAGAAARYRLAETVRLYAGGALERAGEAAALGERHAAWCLRIVEEAAKAGEGGPGPAALEVEADNVRAALEWCVTGERAELGLRLASAHMVAWEATGRVAEAWEWLGRVLAISESAPASLRARALSHAGFAALMLGQLDAARREVEASLALSEEAGDPPSVIERTKGLLGVVSTFDDGPVGVEDLERALVGARDGDDAHLPDALVGCGQARMFRGEPAAARGHFAELVALARRRGEDAKLAVGLVGLGAALIAEGDCRTAGHHLREGLAVAARAGEVHTETIATIWLAEAARLAGDAEGAHRQLEECLARARPMGAPYPLALALLGLGRAALDQGDAEAARRRFDEALAVAVPARLGHLDAAALDGLGEAALALDDPASAQELFERALGVAQRCGDRTSTAHATYQLGELARARGDLDQAVSLHHEALRHFHAVGAHLGVADCLDALAGLAVPRDGVDVAARLFGAGQALHEAGGVIPTARRRDQHDVDLAEARDRSSPEEFAAAWHEGAALPVEEAVAYASKGRGPRQRPSAGWAALTPAERQVVELVRQGHTNAEVAARLFNSPQTVKAHLARAFRKLGIRSRRELQRDDHIDA